LSAREVSGMKHVLTTKANAARTEIIFIAIELFFICLSPSFIRKIFPEQNF
jgi:hypothetical protein